MIDTRVLAYEIRADGKAGKLLAAGSLLLPYITLFHPDETAEQEDDLFRPLTDYLERPGPAMRRVRLSVRRGSKAESIDATLLTGHVGDAPVFTAVLDRRSRFACTPLVFKGDREKDVHVITRHIKAIRRQIETADRHRRPPTQTSIVHDDVEPLKSNWPAGAWPPKPRPNQNWVLERPDWLPPFLCFPIPFGDYLKLPGCHFMCRLLCSCPP